MVVLRVPIRMRKTIISNDVGPLCVNLLLEFWIVWIWIQQAKKQLCANVIETNSGSCSAAVCCRDLRKRLLRFWLL